MSLGGGVRAFQKRQRAMSWLSASVDRRLALAGGLSMLGYLAVFIALHIRSIGWAPGQLLDRWPGYWQFFYGAAVSEERVMAARRSAMAAPHPLMLIGAFALLAVGYLATMRVLRALPAERPARLRTLLLMALVFSVPLLALPNLLSGDVYSNISFGRVAAVHGGNPFIEPPGGYRSDPYLGWVDWKNVPSVYGPAWIYPSMLLTVAVEAVWPSILGYVLAYKLLALALHLLNGVLIWSILGRWRPQQRGWGTALYLLNPLALLEFAGNAHNDVLMITFILLGIVLHLRGWWPLAVAAFTLAVLAKWIALPLLLLYALLLLRNAPTIRGRTRAVAGSLGIFAALAAGLYLPYWEGPATLRVLIDAPPQQRFNNSLGQIVVREVQHGMYRLGRWPHPAYETFVPLTPRVPLRRTVAPDGRRDWRSHQRELIERYNRQEQAKRSRVLATQRRVENVVRLVGLGLVLAACLAGALVTRNLATMLLATAWIFFVYTTMGAAWVWPWYATWFVALAALLDWRVTGRTAVLLSLLAPLLYPLYPHLPASAPLEHWRALLVFGPPLLFAGYHLRRIARTRMG